MINTKYEQLSQMTNDDLLQELVHRMENFSKYKLLMDMWNTFKGWEGETYAFKIQRRSTCYKGAIVKPGDLPDQLTTGCFWAHEKPEIGDTVTIEHVPGEYYTGKLAIIEDQMGN